MEKKELYKLLGLKKTETKIYESMRTFKSIADIAIENKLARMTVHITIKRFLKRGLIVFETKGKRKFFKQNTQNNFLGNTTLPINDYENITIHKGRIELLKIWEKTSEFKNERYLAYQSNYSAINIIKKSKLNDIITLNNNIRNNKQIAEVFLEKGYLESFSKSIHMNTSSFKKWVKSLERTSIVYEIGRSTFYSQNDLFVIRDSLFIMDWNKEIAIEIKQLETVDIIKQLFENLKYSGQRVDFNSKISNFS